MAVLGDDPFAALMRLQRQLDDSLGRPLGTTTTGGGAFPPINVFQKGDGFVVTAEAPGVDKRTLQIEVRKNQLRIAGHRASGKTEQMSVHRRERAVGDFDRTIALPEPVDASTVTARYEHGMLIITLPHAAEARSRTITVS